VGGQNLIGWPGGPGISGKLTQSRPNKSTLSYVFRLWVRLLLIGNGGNPKKVTG
jgi:hypothetical protein